MLVRSMFMSIIFSWFFFPPFLASHAHPADLQFFLSIIKAVKIYSLLVKDQRGLVSEPIPLHYVLYKYMWAQFPLAKSL